MEIIRKKQQQTNTNNPIKNIMLLLKRDPHRSICICGDEHVCIIYYVVGIVWVFSMHISLSLHF